MAPSDQSSGMSTSPLTSRAGFSLVEIIVITLIIISVSVFTFARFNEQLSRRQYGQDLERLIAAYTTARSLMSSADTSRCPADAKIEKSKVVKLTDTSYAVRFNCLRDFRSANPIPEPDLTLYEQRLSGQSTFAQSTLDGELATYVSPTRATPDQVAVITGPQGLCTCVRVANTGLILRSLSCTAGTCTY